MGRTRLRSARRCVLGDPVHSQEDALVRRTALLTSRVLSQKFKLDIQLDLLFAGDQIARQKSRRWRRFIGEPTRKPHCELAFEVRTGELSLLVTGL